MGAFHVTPVANVEQPAAPDRKQPPDTRGRSKRLPGSDPMGGGMFQRGAGGQDIRGQRWIVLTGLVPIEKQETAYADTFKQSLGYDPQNDYPVYSGYLVERVEVAGAADAAHPDWSKATRFVLTKVINQASEKWTPLGTDIVAPEYLDKDKALVFPLPPLVNRFWDADASAAHEPEIPVEKIGPGEQGPGDIMRLRGVGGGMMPRGPMFGERGGRESSTETGPFEEPGRAGETPKKPTETENRIEEKKAPANKLFRFFDFSVEPNKQYVYRVCLALENPNAARSPPF